MARLYQILALVVTCAIIAQAEKGEVILITGASSGIGYATAKVMAAAGFRVIATARREAKLKTLVEEIEADGGVAAYISQDVTNDDDTAKALAFGDEKFGGIDHFFLNAGVAGTFSPLESQTKKDIDFVLDVDLRAVFHNFHDAVIYLKERTAPNKSIILMSSYTGSFNAKHYAGMACGGATPYTAAKAGIDMITRSAPAYTQYGIRIYNVKPNFYHSEMVSRVAVEFAGGNPDAFGAYNNFFKNNAGNPTHIGHVVKAFADGSTKYPSGSNVICDGDATFNSHLLNKWLDDSDDAPGVLERWVTRDQLRGYDGGPYKCQSKKTCDYVKSLEPKKYTVTESRVLPIPAATAREIISFANAGKLLNIEFEIVGDGVSVGSTRAGRLAGALVYETLIATSDFGYSYVLEFDKCENIEELIPHDFSDHVGIVSVVEVDDQSSVITYTLTFKTTALDKLKPVLQGLIKSLIDGIPKKAAEMNENKEL